MSPTFHSNVERSGEVARSLGVAGVLPKPLRRDALLFGWRFGPCRARRRVDLRHSVRGLGSLDSLR